GHTAVGGDPASFDDIRWRLDVWNASAQVANDVL
ncbi:MAG TPA: histidine phosphatase family protein, partial [Mycolicibacterium fallax]|nr:histidine phosphatase family protein [Mycolicibacterium fallax]